MLHQPACTAGSMLEPVGHHAYRPGLRQAMALASLQWHHERCAVCAMHDEGVQSKVIAPCASTPRHLLHRVEQLRVRHVGAHVCARKEHGLAHDHVRPTALG